MSLHETAESIGYRNFHDMVSSNYTKDELIDHIREYLKDEEKKICWNFMKDKKCRLP